MVGIIVGLADGNCATRDDVKLVGGDAQTRNVDLRMTVAISWGSNSQSFAGRRAIPGSRDCSSASVQDYLAEVCGLACRDPATARQVADAMARSPVGHFDELEDGYRIGPLSHEAHEVDACSNCSGHGQVRCTASGCNNGRVHCQACGFTGKERCPGCAGTGSVSLNGGVHSCGRCGGSGRSGNCHMCLGTCYVDCNSCRGTGQVGCGPCAQTGLITHAYSTHLIGRISRSMAFAANAPEGFRRSCQSIVPVSSLAKSAGSLVRAEVGSVAGEARLTLHCQTRHVHADVTCGVERIPVDALGPANAIPLMPSFLDGLTSELVHDIHMASQARPVEALNLASRARMTRDVLAAIIHGSRSDAVRLAAARRWQGAVSAGHVELIDASLRTAYSRAVRSPIRRTWLMLSPVIVGGAVLANAYQAPLWLLHRFVGTAATASALTAIPSIIAAEALSVLPVVVFAWWLAARTGRRQLRAGVGDLGHRGPRQGVWPLLGAFLAMIVGFGTVALKLDAAAMGLPWAPPALAGGRSLGQVLGGEHAVVPVPLKPPGDIHEGPGRRPQDERPRRP